MTTQFIDAIGNPIAVHDAVIHIQQQGWNPATFTKREVIRFTPKLVVLESLTGIWPKKGSSDTFVWPHKLIVLNPVLNQPTYKWQRRADSLARSMTEIGQCKKCHDPYIKGYCCACGTSSPEWTQEQDDEFEALAAERNKR